MESTAGPALIEAVILAGSPGSALCPLSSLGPRHALPVANEPLLRHVARCLHGWGVADATVVVREGDDVCTPVLGGLRLDVVTESEPRGTAGALREVAPRIEAAHILVVEGSLLSAELDVAEALAFHQQRSAGVTAIVHRGPQGSFSEQIRVSETGELEHVAVPYRAPRSVSKDALRLSGIYLIRTDILHMIPPRGHVDIKDQFIPLLLRAGIGVCTYRAQSVRRITTSSEYVEANRALIETSSVPPGSYRELGEDAMAEADVWVAASAEIHGPVLLGEGCRIEPGAIVVGPTAVGPYSVIGRGAVVRESVLWRDVRLGQSALVEHSVVTDRTSVPGGSRISRSVVVDEARCNGWRWLLRRMDPSGLNVLTSHNGRGRIESTPRPLVRRNAYLAGKRLLDLTVAVVGIAALWPVMAVIAIAIKLDSAGPVFFRQARCGRDGRLFNMLKFRSMTADAEQRQQDIEALNEVDGPIFKMSVDPRVTRLGRFLRRSSMDELPQLINVLRGEMSLVGPRPLVMQEMRCAPGWRDIRLMVKPGITGLWQTRSRIHTKFADWIREDIEYVRRQSLLLDIQILLRTAPVVLRWWNAKREPPPAD